MKALIIYMSIHHGNTKKVAERMAKALGADLMEAGDVADPLIVKKYGLVGFGSGIYFGRYHGKVRGLVALMPWMRGRKAFLFSTGGAGKGSFFNRFFGSRLREALSGKGFDVVGEFSCPGWDSWGLLWLVGGVNRGRPDEKDLKKAEEFAKGLKKKVM